MPRRARRWQIWKIAAATAGCMLLSGVLFWLSWLTDTAGGAPTTAPASQSRGMTLPGFFLMLATATAILSVLSVMWLVARIREARKPAWERHRGKKRR